MQPALNKLVFVFSTRGPLWTGMARQLYEQDPLFREVFSQCAHEVQKLLGWSLREEFTRPPDSYRLHVSEEHMEPALTAIQIALCDVWESRGIRPDAVVSMSAGEIAAAYAAGVLTLEDAMRVACTFSSVVRRRLGLGRILSVRLNAEEAEALCNDLPRPVYVTVQYSPTLTMLAGDEVAIELARVLLDEKGVSYWRIPSEFAFHTPLTDCWEPIFREALRDLRPCPPRIPVYSSSVGGRLEGRAFDPVLWFRALWQPVLYTSAVSALLQDGYSTFLEIGPHPSLSKPIKEVASILGKEVVVLPSMLRGESESAVLQRSLATLRSLGVGTYPLLGDPNA